MVSNKGITLRYFDGCPNWEVARTRLDAARRLVGDRRTVTLERVETPEQATALGFKGSPTILVDGIDPFDGIGPTGLSCRVYRTDAGLEGAPSVDQLTAVLREAL